MAQDTLRGRFIWHELMTTDTGAAATFYQKVVGWNTQSWPQDKSYTMLLAGKQPVAGLMALPEDAKAMGTPPNWLSYIGTADVDATSARLEKLGGKILRAAWNIPTVGRVAIVQDSQGAVFGLYAPETPMPASNRPSLGEFSWHELATDDPALALAFYQDLFGWEKTSSMDMSPEMGSYDMFGWSGVPMGGIFKRPPNVPANWLPYAMVPDSKKVATTIAALGAKVVNGPMEVPGGDWIVVGLDRQGATFAVHSMKPAAKKATAVAKKVVVKTIAAKTVVVARKVVKKTAKKAVKPARRAAAGKRSRRAKPAKAKPVKKSASRTGARRATKPKRKARR